MSGNSLQAPRVKIVSSVLSFAALMLLLVWLEGGFEKKVEPGLAAADDRAPLSGPIVKALTEEINEVVSWPGTVTSRIEAQLAPKLAARIDAILVRPGDRVSRGQILVRLDDRSLQARLAQARSALSAAEAEAVRSRADLRRTQNLFAKEAATKQSLDAAVAATRSAEARVREMQSAIQEIETLFTETALSAPFDGVVVKRHREPGDTALAGTPILTILEPLRLRVEVAIPVNCMGGVHDGQPLRIIDRSSGRNHSATVDEIAPSADAQTQTVLVKARLPEHSSFQPGAFVWVEQDCGRRRTLLIPQTAVTRTGQLESVRLVREGRTQLRHVRTGQQFGDRIEILSGLAEGDAVLLGDHP